jgi:predicted nuclease of restriction endonuclease-like RecB superfamily
MLTGDLVRARAKDGVLRPAFVKPDDAKVRQRADDLVALFTEGVGRTRGELEEEIEGIVGDGVDHKLVKGLVKVVFDRADFETRAPVDPAELRDRVFRMAARRGPLAEVAVEGGPPTVAGIYAAVAAELGCDAASLPAALYGDHADRQVLLDARVPDATWLLHRYNVALVQAVLLKAHELRVTIAATPERLRQLLRAVKFHQLIHHARPVEKGWELTLDGPASLFSQTTKYGVALAKFFPALLLQPGEWTAEGRVNWPRAGRISLSSGDGLVSHYRDAGAWVPQEATWFAERWEALDTGWTLVRDAAPLDQGGEGVVVPDFTFRKGRRVAHLEILGFWRKGTVQKRLALLKRHGPKNLVLAVSKRLAGEEAELPDSVVVFKDIVPAKKVLELVEAVAR